jgi:HEAT repeat protein
VSKVDDAGNGLRTLIDAFNAAQTPEDRVLSLRALGNSGDARIVPLALGALSDANADVRGAAVNAVRFVAGAEADQLLASAMLSDTDPEVRRKAIDTVTGFRFVPSFFAAYGAILSQETFPLVRRAVAQSLDKVRSTPEAIGLLQRASSDASEDVRAVALASLSAVTQ